MSQSRVYRYFRSGDGSFRFRFGGTAAAVPAPLVSLVVAASLLVASAGWSRAQDEDEAARRTFRASSQVVLLDVHVTDASGTPLTGLSAEDFVVREDDIVQPISFFATASDTGPLPSSVLLLIDTSSSMTGEEMEKVRRAALDFIDRASEPADAEIAVAAFDDRLHPLCDFTRDRAILEEAVTRLTPSGGTALYDAIFDAVALLDAAPHPRGSLFLFTDGKDLDSTRTFDELERRLEASAVVVYAVGQYEDERRRLYMSGEKYFKPPAFEVNLSPVWALRRLAELTGGRALFPERKEGVSRFLTSAVNDWGQVYVLGYGVSAEASGDEESASWHQVDVRLDPTRFLPGSYVVRTRRGYRR